MATPPLLSRLLRPVRQISPFGNLCHGLCHCPGNGQLDGHTGTNISGTADLAPLDKQADMIQELFPDAKTVGLLYCSAEPNSSYQVGVIKPLLEEMGYTCTEYAFADSNDVASVTTSACASSDVIYIPTDNTAASCTEAIRNVVVPAGVPLWLENRASALAAAWRLCLSTTTNWAS